MGFIDAPPSSRTETDIQASIKAAMSNPHHAKQVGIDAPVQPVAPINNQSGIDVTPVQPEVLETVFSDDYISQDVLDYLVKHPTGDAVKYLVECYDDLSPEEAQEFVDKAKSSIASVEIPAEVSEPVTKPVAVLGGFGVSGNSPPVPERPAYLQKALAQAAVGIPVHFLPAGQKGAKGAACLGWEVNATTDPVEIVRQAEMHPDMTNYACVARATLGSPFFLDDDGGICAAFEATGGVMQPTLKNQSCSGNFHYIYRHSANSLAFWRRIGESASVKETNPNGGELWSLRMDRAYIVGPGSFAMNHAKVLGEYKTAHNGPIIEIPDDLLQFLSDRWEAMSGKTGNSIEKAKDWIYEPIVHGDINNRLAKIGGWYIQTKNIDDGDVLAAILIDHAEKQAVYEDGLTRFSCNLDEIKIIASGLVSRYKTGEQKAQEQAIHFNGVAAGTADLKAGVLVLVEPADNGASIPEPPDENSEAAIPPFDPTVINGIFKKIVELVCRGTTLEPQFAFVIAKAVVGIRMAGHVKFEDLDVETRYYIALIAQTGGGKGEAWRRIFKILCPEYVKIGCRIKIINSADSGAGLKDLFFEEPTREPVLCYIDEVESLGNKSKDTRNPGILDTMIELADSTSISRVLAKRQGGGSKTKHDARLCMVMCGQDGNVYMKAFAGRTKLGWYDRLYPEYGVPQETGDLPPISPADAIEILTELNALDYSGMMKMSPGAKTCLDDFWSAQPGEVRKKARWKKNLMLDAYVSAFGRGIKTVDTEDVGIAVKIFVRQIVIRRVHFTTEVPDRTGYYIGLIKNIIVRMERRLAAGVPIGQVAKSRRDFETETHAFRDNEGHLFARAWDVHSRVYLTAVQVKKANGQAYTKYLPSEE
jgi:hypothetical protein